MKKMKLEDNRLEDNYTINDELNDFKMKMIVMMFKIK